MTDVLVIGAGAAGCMAAIKAAEAGATVILIEKNTRIGRKIMLTGKGRCNMTNAKPWSQFAAHLHSKPAFFKPAFYNFSNSATVDFFRSIGVETVVTRDDRVFPQTMSSATVVDALADRLAYLGVKTFFGCTVGEVTRTPDGCFTTAFIENNHNFFHPKMVSSKTVIVATGGLSYPTTGSDGAGYAIARSFGHTLQPTFPSLTALTPAGYDMRLQGATLINVAASLFVGQDMVQYEFGELQFTDGGIEGPIGFKLSRKAVWAMINGDKVSVAIDLKPAVPLDALADRIAKEAGQEKVTDANFSRCYGRFLRRFMPQSIVEPFYAGCRPSLSGLASALKSWRFQIAGYVGYKRAVVTAGGVSLDEIVSKTMSSRNVPGLYFAGEVLDMDGDTGGYNLQFAFSTGVLAAESAAKYAAEH